MRDPRKDPMPGDVLQKYPISGVWSSWCVQAVAGDDVTVVAITATGATKEWFPMARWRKEMATAAVLKTSPDVPVKTSQRATP